MRAARVLRFGPPDSVPESVVVQDLPEPRPGPGEALVRVRHAAVNFPDVLIAAGRYQVRVPAPFTLGSEFSGVVVAQGAGAERFRVGDEVMGATMTGAFAELVAVPEAALHPVPPGLSSVDAAAFHVTYTTAYHALCTIGGARAGETVVVLGAAGGVGSAAVDLGARLGLRVVAAASSAERARRALALGAAAAVDYGREDLKARLKELTVGGADVVVDPVGGSYSEPALRAVRWGGRFVCVGFAAGEIPRIPLNIVLLKGVVVRGFELRTIAEHRPESVGEAREVLERLVAAGMRPMVSHVVPLADIGRALADVAGRRAVGKVVVEVA